MLTRCLTVWLAVTVVASTVILWSLTGLDPSAPLRFDTVLASGAAVALAGCAAWAWLVTTVVVVEALAGHRRAVPGVPAWARRLLLAACGAAVLAGAPAHAADGLAGLPLPDRPSGSVVRGHAPAPVTGHGHAYVVQPGDSLWAITAVHLPRGASDARVARCTTALHRLNRDVVGPDPDVVRPGQRLRMPEVLAGTERGAR